MINITYIKNYNKIRTYSNSLLQICTHNITHTGMVFESNGRCHVPKIPECCGSDNSGVFRLVRKGEIGRQIKCPIQGHNGRYYMM